jgi:SAM-dependent methyltransferase
METNQVNRTVSRSAVYRPIIHTPLRKPEKISHRIYGSYKRDLYRKIDGLVVEIFPGTGINFNYLPNKTDWIGIEPNETFYDTLLTQAKIKGIHARLLSFADAKIPLSDNTADAVICSLVFCSINHPKQLIAEIKRVLKPGGRFFFIEHVIDAKYTPLWLVQHILNPINRIITQGCNCNRSTWKEIYTAGFSEVLMNCMELKDAPFLHKPHIMGFAIK